MVTFLATAVNTEGGPHTLSGGLASKDPGSLFRRAVLHRQNMAFATDSATPDTLDIECQIFWMLLKRLKFHPTSLELGLVPQIYIRVSIARFTLQKWPSLLKACLLRATSVSPV